VKSRSPLGDSSGCALSVVEQAFRPKVTMKRQASLFLVEDEALIRMMLVDMVEELGHRVITQAGNVVEARSLAETEDYDLAILDINLKGSNVRPVAEAIAARSLPLLFLSGYGSAGLPDGFEGVPVLTKPCTPELLKKEIDSILSGSA
jgi:CheY-like chemotaxis protein